MKQHHQPSHQEALIPSSWTARKVVEKADADAEAEAEAETEAEAECSGGVKVMVRWRVVCGDTLCSAEMKTNNTKKEESR